MCVAVGYMCVLNKSVCRGLKFWGTIVPDAIGGGFFYLLLFEFEQYASSAV